MKNSGTDRCLIIGIGNDSRQDDGLGWALLDRIGQVYGDHANLVYRYQLNIEDADLIKDTDCVLFVDACYDALAGGSAIDVCASNGDITFTTHALSPAAVLALCEQVYNKKPAAYLLRMQGYAWELKTGLTPEGKKNLESGFELFERFFQQTESTGFLGTSNLESF